MDGEHACGRERCPVQREPPYTNFKLSKTPPETPSVYMIIRRNVQRAPIAL
jgi:hypothetical protein